MSSPTCAPTTKALDVDEGPSDTLGESPSSPSFTIVAAMTRSSALGQQGQLPWGRLPKEMAAFRNLTRTTVDPIKSNALIMGRLTFDSLPRRRPLPGRIHVVLTRRPPGTDVYPEGVLTAPSIDDALAMLAGRVEKVFVVGGARAYSEAITHPACEGLWLTQIINPDYPDADVFFPDMPLGMYDRGQALDEPAQECGVTYQRFYHARVAVAADP